MEIQKINWKLCFENPAAAKPHDFFKVFNTWIPDSPEVFIDVADYEHVKDGPWTLLIGHYADYSLDHTDRQLGFTRNEKRTLDQATPQASLKRFIEASIRLVNDPLFKGALSLKTDEFVFVVNDRASRPNTKEQFLAVKSELEGLASKIFGNKDFSLTHRDEPAQRLTVTIRGKSQPKLQEILARLN